jgi:hypothetical protein
MNICRYDRATCQNLTPPWPSSRATKLFICVRVRVRREGLLNQLLSAAGKITVALADYSPNLPAFKRLQYLQPQQIHRISTPVSALDVPKELQGFRTVFSAFHHFRPELPAKS